MKLLKNGVVFPSAPGTDRQSCAFPQVAVLPGGRWLVGCRAACTKGGKDGQHVMLAVSDDEGGSWRLISGRSRSDRRGLDGTGGTPAPSAGNRCKPVAAGVSPADPAGQSDNGNLTSSPFKAPALDGKPGQFRALGLTALGGPRVLATLYWVDNSDPALPFFNEKTEGLLDSRIMCAESDDGGETWSQPVLMDTTPFHGPTPITGPVLLLPDGERVCQFETNKSYYDESKWIHSSVLMFSLDGGRTWPRHSVVTRHPTVFYWDQRPQVLRDGRILDLFWTYDNQAAAYLNIHARESRDGGRSWSELWDTGVPGQPAPVVQLADGRLAMVYVDRTGAPAIRCRTSADGGRSWPVETALTLYESVLPSQTVHKDGMADAWSEMGKFSVGLPATASLPDGDMLVVYYAGPGTDCTSVQWARVGA